MGILTILFRTFWNLHARDDVAWVDYCCHPLSGTGVLWNRDRKVQRSQWQLGPGQSH